METDRHSIYTYVLCHETDRPLDVVGGGGVSSRGTITQKRDSYLYIYLCITI